VHFKVSFPAVKDHFTELNLTQPQKKATPGLTEAALS
jgi:hypothetical protein